MGDTFVAYLHPDDVGHNFHKALTDLMLYDRGRHVAQSGDMRCGAGGLDNGRNSIMRAFLESPHEWLFMVDADMGFQPNALEMLRQVADPTERPIVGGLCFAQRDMSHDGRGGYRWTPKPTIFDRVDLPGEPIYVHRHHYPVNALVRCDATGGAFLLIHRSVGEKIGTDWFSRIAEDRTPVPAGERLMHQTQVSEDLSFFLRCDEHEIPCHVFTGVKTNHLKSTWVDERDFWTDFEAPPALDEVDVIVPVLHRPQNVAPFMQTLRASTGLARAWFVCERSDSEQHAEVERHGGRVLREDGSFATKVNYAYRKIKSDAPWIFITGDDVLFRPGWLDHAQFVAHTYGGQVVGTNDLGNPRVTRGDHATHLLMAREYIDTHGGGWDGPGVVCHEGYRHWYVDDEIVNAARQRNVWQMALGSVVEHMHPIWGKAANDDIYELGQSAAESDAAKFHERFAQYVPEMAA